VLQKLDFLIGYKLTPSRASAQGRRRRNSKAPSRAGLFLTSKNRTTVICIALAAATLTLYSPVVGHGFVVLDDADYVTANSHVHRGLAWSTFKWAFTSTDAANWHPLTWLSHALDYQLFALNPIGHHLDCVLIHSLNVVLLFLLLASTTKRLGPSMLAAALFAIHPLNVESVAWVAERKNVLSTLFFLLALMAYVRYTRLPNWRGYLLVGVLFAAGLMAKPMVITLPCVLVLLDYWPLRRISGRPHSDAHALQFTFFRSLLEKIPLLMLSVGSAWITLKAQRLGLAMRSLHRIPLGLRLENAVVSYGLYLWKMVWPARLAALYPHSAIALPEWEWILSALVVVGVTVIVSIFRNKRYLPVGWLWFLGTLVPVIGLVQVGDAAMADRYTYLPLIGIFIIIAWGLADFAEAENVSTIWRVIPAVCVLVVLCLVTLRQLSYWQNRYTLWAHTLRVTERNPFAEDAMGSALMDPDLAMTASNLDGLDTVPKRMDAARMHFEQALELSRELAQRNQGYLPDMAITLIDLANQNRALRRFDEARQHYEEALSVYRQLAEQNPGDYVPYVAITLTDLGILDRLQNQTDDGVRHYEEALKDYRELAQQYPETFLPYLAMTLNDFGNLNRIQKRSLDAHDHYEASCVIYRQLVQQDAEKYLPYLARTLFNLGVLDRDQGRIAESRSDYQKALVIFQQLSRSQAGYASDVARVEASLKGLEGNAPSR
jgi:tetratricopeptide (TPR) repeat protein